MRYCKECEHYDYDFDRDASDRWGSCEHPNNYERDIVSGKLIRIDDMAYMTRNNPRKCGISAKWFEPKIPMREKIKNYFKRK